MINNLPQDLLDSIQRLNEVQLRTLYQIVVERMKLINKARTLMSLKKFQLFDSVSFQHLEKKIEGIVTRINQKSVTVKVNDELDHNHYWNVHPNLLRKTGKNNVFKEIMEKKY